ncbi:MAG: hypothetical protein K5746_06250 [Clostridiales bacterium]|nr:hypothetical protein [Clostridiales bacterium]
MTESQRAWSSARDGLVAAVTSLGFSAELAELMAAQLGSPKAIRRMTAYVYEAHPRTEEMLVDEMLSICAEIDSWRERKASREAQASYNAMLFYGMIGQEEREED